MKNKINKYLYWTPRILSIIFICFLATFSLDVFDENTNFWQNILAFLIHNIPVFILIIILLISWEKEIIGGIAFILAGIGYILILFLEPKFEWYMISWSIIIAVPAVLIGILFLLNWFKKKKN